MKKQREQKIAKEIVDTGKAAASGSDKRSAKPIKPKSATGSKNTDAEVPVKKQVQYFPVIKYILCIKLLSISRALDLIF